GILVDEASWLINVDTGESAKSTVLGATATGTRETAIVGGLKNMSTDNGIEFVNQTLRSYYENVDISHERLVARTPQQTGVVERRNHTLVKAARTMLIYAKVPLFL
nr:integrase, catalytic region, zinc finger, CCHC-type, peptidase aspartic, catalytic [Tanacetum cinerariifolium]